MINLFGSLILLFLKKWSATWSQCESSSIKPFDKGVFLFVTSAVAVCLVSSRLLSRLSNFANTIARNRRLPCVISVGEELYWMASIEEDWILVGKFIVHFFPIVQLSSTASHWTIYQPISCNWITRRFVIKYRAIFVNNIAAITARGIFSLTLHVVATQDPNKAYMHITLRVTRHVRTKFMQHRSPFEKESIETMSEDCDTRGRRCLLPIRTCGSRSWFLV